MKVKLHKGGIERVMLFGVPKVIAVVEGMAAAICVLAFHSLLVIPFIITIHIALSQLYKIDPYYVEILISHIREDDYLEP